MNSPKRIVNNEVLHLFVELDEDEVISIELVNGNKIYLLQSDEFYPESPIITIVKQIKDQRQKIIIDVTAIAVICTMSRKTYDLKLQRGELYV